MAEQITQEITALPEAPKEGAGFRARAANYLNKLVGFSLQLATWRGQVNAVTDWINSMSWHVETQVSMADGAKSSAVTAAMQSSNSADRASAAANAAINSAGEALASENAAETAEANSAAYANGAEIAKSQAIVAKDSAITAAIQSSNSADRASESAVSALASKNSASDSATSAATSEANALASKNAAANSATNAENSATAAAAAATVAESMTVYYGKPVESFYDPSPGIPQIPDGLPEVESSALRYIASATANGWTKNYIYTSSNGSWIEIVPSVGMSLLVSGVRYYYVGFAWYAEAVFAAAPDHYARSAKWSRTSANRLGIPGFVSCNIGGVPCYWKPTSSSSYLLSLASAWDSTATNYTVAANRSGKDFYIYAVISADTGGMGFKLSANATTPVGYTASTSRKIGGFHCLCADVGVISGHPLSGYLAGDILPASVWDLLHRPACSPEGMVYVEGLGKWVDIYLASVSGGALVSVLGGTIADGTSTPAFHWCKFSQWFGQAGKRLPTQHDFVALSLGSNQGTNIAGGTDPVTTGGHVDTAGRRMVSNVGCEDCCGVLWQWGSEPGGGAASAAWVNAFDGNDAGVAGQSYQAPNRALLGGGWGDGAVCGSRGSLWNSGPLALHAALGARGVAEPLAV